MLLCTSSVRNSLNQQQRSVSLSLTAALRRNATATEAAAAAAAAATSGTTTAAASSPSSSDVSATPADKATLSWSVYCPPVWRLVGVTNRRAVREQTAAGRAVEAAKEAILAATKAATVSGDPAAVDSAKKKLAEAQLAANSLRSKTPILGDNTAEEKIANSGAESVAAPAPSPATTYFFHGTRLGTRPIVVLDEIIPHAIADALFATVVANGGTGEGIAASSQPSLGPLARYESLLNELSHKHGALSLPLVGPKGFDTPESLEDLSATEKLQFLSNYCDDVVTMLDVLNVQHATIIARSTGALIALKLAALYPERVGGIVICDTPLLTKHWLNNTETRKDILKAAEDVNVPRSDLEFAIRSLLESGEGVEAGEGLEPAAAAPFVPATPPASTDSDKTINAFNKAIYEKVIFSKDIVFPKGIVLAENSIAAKHLNDSPLFSHIAVGPNAATAAKYLGTLCADSESAASADISVHSNNKDINVLADSTTGSKLKAVPVLEGLYRSDKAYLSPESIAAIRHPILLVQPSTNAVADGNLHKNVLNLRKPTIINLAGDEKPSGGGGAAEKGGKNSKKGGGKGKAEAEDKATDAPEVKKSKPAANSIFDAAVSSSFAKQVATFTNRFELDVTIGKRFEQTAADLLRNMTNAQSVGGVNADDSGAKGKGKGKGKAKK